jgi:hypothetical protein
MKAQPSPNASLVGQGLSEEHWKTLGLQQRWTLVVLTIQATAAAGTFLAAMIGLWSVSPIITYRIHEQERLAEAGAAETAITLPDTHPVTAKFVQDVYGWWQSQVESYQRIIELIETRETLGAEVRFELREEAQIPDVPASVSDFLVVTARGPDGREETVTAPVNENAMPLTQYIQFRINHGAFAELDPETRQRVEEAVARYTRFYMTPRVSPPHVGTTMTLDEVSKEIQSCQQLRIGAFKHIQALNAVIEVALLG